MKISVQPPPAGERRYSTAARTSCWIPSGVVCATWSMYGNSSSRLADAGSAPEVVEGDGGIPALTEAQRELFVEAVEAADVREHDDADRARLVRDGGERGELVAVSRPEGEILGAHRRSTREGRDRRQGVELEAHCSTVARRHRPRQRRTARRRRQAVTRLRRYRGCTPPRAGRLRAGDG